MEALGSTTNTDGQVCQRIKPGLNSLDYSFCTHEKVHQGFKSGLNRPDCSCCTQGTFGDIK